jgi:hypothetical protein
MSQVCFISPILNHPDGYGELVATTVVSDMCCVVLHCHAERLHLMANHFFGLAGLGGLVGRFYYQGHLFDERSGRLGCDEKYGWWLGGGVFYSLMLLNPYPSFNHL